MVRIYPFLLKILSRNETDIAQGPQLCNEFKTFVCDNPNLDLVNINVNAKFSQDPFIHSQNIKGNKILTSIKGHNSVAN